MGSNRRRQRAPRDRRSRRSDAHDLAQAEAEQIADAAVPDDPLIPAGTPTLIEDDAALAALIEHVREEGSFAYDTEFIGEETYHPRLCLLQIATARRIALVDPLADVDLTPIWEVLADPAVEGVLHAGGQDLEPVMRHLGRPPANVFDTQVAAGFVGLPYPLGLRALLECLLGLEIGKGLTFTKWDARPLSRVHARYAADDVRYLPAVRSRLRDLLRARGHEGWARAECAVVEDEGQYRFDPERRAARVIGSRKFRPREQAILKELIVWRDGVARAEDVPPRTLLKDEVLLRLARDPAKSVERLGQIKHMPWPVAERHGAAILSAVERGRETSARNGAYAPTKGESTAQRITIDGLWSLVQSYCYGRGIDPGLVTNRREIAEYVLSPREGPHAFRAFFTGWRGELLGPLLHSCEDGTCRVVVEWHDALPFSQCAAPAATERVTPSHGPLLSHPV